MTAERTGDAIGAARGGPAPLSQQLREGTREAHERVEERASFNRLIVVRLPALPADAPAALIAHHASAVQEYREVYRRFLVAARGFEAAVDARLATPEARALADRHGFAREASSSADLIAADLGRLRGGGASREPATTCELLPIRTLPELVGVEYVRRGSRAGGAVIAAVVRQNLGLTREDGAAFLAQYGKETRSVIGAYKDWADALALSEADRRAAVAAAVATFLAVEGWHADLEAQFARG
jgi:heme oxygenase